MGKGNRSKKSKGTGRLSGVFARLQKESDDANVIASLLQELRSHEAGPAYVVNVKGIPILLNIMTKHRDNLSVLCPAAELLKDMTSSQHRSKEVFPDLLAHNAVLVAVVSMRQHPDHSELQASLCYLLAGIMAWQSEFEEVFDQVKRFHGYTDIIKAVVRCPDSFDIQFVACNLVQYDGICEELEASAREEGTTMIQLILMALDKFKDDGRLVMDAFHGLVSLNESSASSLPQDRVPLILHVLREPPTMESWDEKKELLIDGLDLLQDLAKGDERVRRILVQNGVIHVLLNDMMKRHSDDAELVTSVGKALWVILYQNSEAREDVLSACKNGMFELLRSLTVKHNSNMDCLAILPSLCMSVLGIFYEDEKEDEIQTALAQSGLLLSMAKVLRGSTSKEGELGQDSFCVVINFLSWTHQEIVGSAVCGEELSHVVKQAILAFEEDFGRIPSARGNVVCYVEDEFLTDPVILGAIRKDPVLGVVLDTHFRCTTKKEGNKDVENAAYMTMVRCIAWHSANIDIVKFKRCGKCNGALGFQEGFACGRCNVVLYCNSECQAADWQTHKQSCKKASAKSKTKKG